MHYIEVAPVRLVRKDAQWFTYASQSQLESGTVVRIPIGKTSSLGIVLATVAKPTFSCKPIDDVIDETPLPPQLIQTARWVSEYYQTHLSHSLALLLPSGIEKKRRPRPLKTAAPSIRLHESHTPTPAQSAAITDILDKKSQTKLLFGVTGSGKTLVYIESAKKLFSQGLSSIILVPEIALTSQIVDEFKNVFGDDVLLAHSRQTEAERHAIWKQSLDASSPKVIIGPRSALFLPLRRLGLIILDEFHEPSYKQEQQPRYSALRVATMLARFHDGVTVFGSATPPIAEYYTARQAGAPIISLPSTARDTVKSRTTLIDMTKRQNFTKHRFLSNALIAEIDVALGQSKQALIFHNRRGTASTTLCDNCGWSAVDPDTDLPLTLHADKYLLISHITGHTQPVPTSCPRCHGADIIHKGIGTKLLESELQKLYPNKNIVRFDGDGTKENTVEQRYRELYNGEIDIIIGTQVLAKGIDLPHLHTVGVIQADAGLSLPDYMASERTFQLLAQVVGRVGRNHHESSVIVQSYQPQHIAVTAGIAQDYQTLYQETIMDRQRSNFPPFCYLARFMCTYKTEAAAVKNSRALLKTLRSHASSDITFFGPAPAFYEKQHGTYRWHIIAKSPSRSSLGAIVKYLPSSHWQFELDPLNLL